MPPRYCLREPEPGGAYLTIVKRPVTVMGLAPLLVAVKLKVPDAVCAAKFSAVNVTVPVSYTHLTLPTNREV